MTIDQESEVLELISQLTPNEYQARRPWLARLADPAFDLKTLDGILTPTTYGTAIMPPFDGAILDEDGPGDETFDVSRLMLIPILKDEENQTTVKEAVRKGQANSGTNWGERAAFVVREAGNAGKISLEVWPVGCYALFTKTIWRDRDDSRYAWCVFRSEGGFTCGYRWFTFVVNASGRFPSLRK